MTGVKHVLGEFVRLLRLRFQLNGFTTEDSIRYTFFAALLAKSQLEPHDVVLEFPHPEIHGARIDTWVPSFEERPLAIEFKYDRENPSGSTVPRTQNAGELFKDMARLARLPTTPDPLRLLVYCTDSKMATYFQKPDNGHTAFFNLADSDRVTIDAAYVMSKPATFQKSLGSDLSVELTCRAAECPSVQTSSEDL